MSKVRVYEVARELGLDNQELIRRVGTLGIQVKNHMSVLEPAEVERVKRALDKSRVEDTVEEQIRPTVTRRRSKRADDEAAQAEASRPEPAIVAPVRRAPRPDAASVVAPSRPEAKSEPVAAKAEPVVEAERRVMPEPKPEPVVEAKSEPKPEPVEAERRVSPEPKPEPVVEAKPEPEPAPRRVEAIAPPPPPAEPEPEPVVAKVEPKSEPAPEPVEAREDRASQIPAADERLGSLPPGVKRRGNTVAPPPGAGPRKVLTPEERRRIVEEHQASRPRRREIRNRSSIGPQARPQARGKRRQLAPGRKPQAPQITTPGAQKRRIRIEDQIQLQALAQRMSLKATDLLMKLMQMGVQGVHINSTLDADTAILIADEFGYEVENVAQSIDEVVGDARGEFEDLDEDREVKAPVVTIMGHVDHGKTSLLDKIRSANVAAGEAGGITQHISAFRVETPKGEVVFLDTPGHEAFTSMRARGAQATDVVVLVVAADDGVMPQTREAASHAQAAEVPIIVAVNKIDKPDAQSERVMNELAALGLTPEEWGGDTIYVPTSAITGQGIDDLLESLAVQAEVLELRCNPKIPAEGVVLEARLDKGRGVVANVLVQDGTLSTGDYVVAGTAWGRVRALTDDRGRMLKSAPPATPVELLGLDQLPSSGEKVYMVTTAKKAQEVAEANRQKVAIRPSVMAPRGLEQLQQMMRSGAQQELQIVLKADVHGSSEALRKSLEDLSTDKVRVKIVQSGVGGITENDVMLASASDGVCIVLGFNVRPQGKASSMAKENGVEIRTYSIIYEAIDDVKLAMAGLLAPKLVERELGKAEVRETFSIPKIGTIAGCMVQEGKIVRSARARLVRDGVVVWTGKLGSLRRFKDDAKEVAQGFECGIGLEGFNDLKNGDIIECFDHEEVAATLEDH
ncbi:MAG: translation initiation factor IF-2 [Sandaracinus sp.]|nr:translation initiation factor IF-2 [Sandaracinus sp.]